MYKYYN